MVPSINALQTTGKFIEDLVHWHERGDSTAERVQNISREALAICCAAFLAHKFSNTSLRLYGLGSMFCLGVTMWNLSLVNKQHLLNPDTAFIEQSIPSFKRNKRVLENFLKWTLVQSICLKRFHPGVSFDFIQMTTLMGFVVYGINACKNYIETSEEEVEPLRQARDHDLLQRMFANIDEDTLIKFMDEETELQEITCQYSRKKEIWLAKAWEELLSSHVFTVQQGLEKHPPALEALATAAIEKEAGQLVLANGRLPPSLRNRYSILSKLTDNIDCEEKKALINTLVQPIIQAPEFLDGPIFAGARAYYLQNRNLSGYLGIQIRVALCGLFELFHWVDPIKKAGVSQE